MFLNCSRLTRNPLFTLIYSVAILFFIAPGAVAQHVSPSTVSALGRLEPEGGVLRIAAASTPYAISGSIITELHVDEGSWV